MKPKRSTYLDYGRPYEPPPPALQQLIDEELERVNEKEQGEQEAAAESKRQYDETHPRWDRKLKRVK